MQKIDKKIIDFFKNNDSFNIFVHTSPDGDCVGSSLGLARFLISSGKKCKILTDSRKDFLYIKSKIDFCSAMENIIDSSLIESVINFNEIKSRESVCVFVDCAEVSRIGKLLDQNLLDDKLAFDIISKESLIIDHHANNRCDNKLQYIRPKVCSASELVVDIVEEMCSIEDKYLATALFYGIASDTGSFRFLTHENAQKTFEICSRLTRCSISPDMICAIIEGGKDREYNEYFISLANGAEYLCDGKAVLIKDDKELLSRYTKNRRPSDELYRFFIKIKGVEVVVFVKYSDDKGWTDASVRVSAFSQFNANEFCMKFGGGGHIKASGFHIKRDFDEVFTDIAKNLAEFLN